MREPTDAEYVAARRVVAKIAKRVRETSGNATVRGRVINVYVDEGFCDFYLSSNYDYRGVETALKQIREVRNVLATSALNIEGEISVTYPQEA